jgi:hypothetical protein
MSEFLKTKKGLEYLLETSPSDMSPIDAIEKYHSDLKESQRMEFTEGDVLFQTKSGTKLEVRNGGLYTTNRQEIEQALEKDLHSDNPMDVQMAESICMLMQKHGLVAEISN